MANEIKTLQKLINEDIDKAHKYFEENKKAIFSELNTIKHGTEILTLFRKLLASLSEKIGINSNKKAINFYYNYRKLLEAIDIRHRENFDIFRQLTLANEVVEMDFHDALSTKVKRVLDASQPRKVDIETLLADIQFGEELLAKSIAKLSRKPDYQKAKSELEMQLKQLADATPAPATPAPVSVAAVGLFNNSSALPASANKPSPPTAISAAAPVVKQLAIKSSAFPLKRRYQEENKDNAKKSAVASAADRPTFQRK